MSVARVRALTHVCHLYRTASHGDVEMSVARVRALTQKTSLKFK